MEKKWKKVVYSGILCTVMTGPLTTFSTVQAASNTGSIGDMVWEDKNQNGRQDAGELGIPNIKMELFNSVGDKVNSVVTDKDGRYLFNNVPNGEYYVKINVPKEYNFYGAARFGTDTLTDYLKVNNNTIHDVDAGLVKKQASLPSFTWVYKPGGDVDLLKTDSITVSKYFTNTGGWQGILFSGIHTGNYALSSSDESVLKWQQTGGGFEILGKTGSSVITVKDKNTGELLKQLTVKIVEPLSSFTWGYKPGGDVNLLNTDSITVSKYFYNTGGWQGILFSGIHTGNYALSSSDESVLKWQQTGGGFEILRKTGSSVITVKDKNTGEVLKRLTVKVVEPLSSFTWIYKPGGDVDLLNTDSISVSKNFYNTGWWQGILFNGIHTGNYALSSSDESVLKWQQTGGGFEILRKIGSSVITVKDKNTGEILKQLTVNVTN
ncbi:SdrD B-like domain-containing protein [Bacillus toyonensis]|uniref:SdrD B-like domain-containing protein n=1 Tax=Bacillus toyonensis TaxID=155322 RepID=UPI000BF9EEF8|nr:SdrD B-like domain-containing protein [Bacillus toyonensis]PGC93925.1 hypothetical protein COM39_06120 [Bacillus toyonensis]